MSENTNDKEKFKEFGLSSMAVDNKTTVFVITFIIVLSGLMAYMSMPRESFPEIVIPTIYVGTPYPGNSPEDIEKLITRPIEKEINSITGINKLTSTSVQGYSTIMAEFDFSVTPSEALRKVKDKVDKAKSDPDFPTDLPADPNVFEMNISELTPIMNINLSGDFAVEELNKYAEYLEEKIEDLSEITEVDIRGVQEKEMKINVDMYKMQSMDISFNDIAGAIQAENLTISGGDVKMGNFRRNVRIVGDFKNADEIKNVIVKQEKFNIVYLGDIADVVFEDKEEESYARELTKPVVMVDVKKRAGENLIIASEKIQEILKKAKKERFPSNLEITITNDQSNQTRNQVNELENNILFGMLLVIGVLLFFLGLRNALFVGIAIPLSMFMAFAILNAMGVTLNMMVLFSLILALGMLVDNGIVVVENVYRLMSEGYSPIKAAKYGVGEVAVPIISSTATTLAAFLPLAFWPGIMGEFMFYLPITLIIVLGSSLFVALVINPMLTSVYMKVVEPPTNRRRFFTIISAMVVVGVILVMADVKMLGNLLVILALLGVINEFLFNPIAAVFQNKLLPALERFYKRFLTYALSGAKPALFFVGTIGLLILSFIMLMKFTPKVIFFPINEPQYVNIFIETPIGTDIERTNEVTKVLEKRVIEYIKKYEVEDEKDGIKHIDNYLVKSVIAQVGQGAADPSQGPSMATTPNKARISVSFVEFQYRRGISTNDVMNEIRDICKDVPGTTIVVDKNSDGPPTGKPINIEVSGDDYNQLITESQNILDFINDKNIPGIEELKLDVEIGKPEMPIVVDRTKARRYNISTSQIGQTLRTSLFGLEVSTFKDGEDDYPIMLRLQDEYRYDANALMDQAVTFRDQTNGQIRQVPISAIASAELSSTFSSVKRKNTTRIITIASNVLNDYNANEVVQEIKDALVDYEIPAENTIKFTGEQEDQAKEMSFLGKALMIAVFLIFLILVSQFNSASTPILIVFSVIFSLIGVFLGLVIFQMDFVVIMTMIGIISLAGIVVNNAIVLIDYTNLLRSRKRAEMGIEDDEHLPMDLLKETIVDSGATRLRPVLLTAITTLLGLLPLATGMNIDFFSFLKTYDANIFFGGDNVIFWGPMSWTVIFGLTFATFLTLVIVPVMYYLLTRLKQILGRVS